MIELSKITKQPNERGILTSVTLNPKDKQFIKDNNIVLRRLIEEALNDIREKQKQTQLLVEEGNNDESTMGT